MCKDWGRKNLNAIVTKIILLPEKMGYSQQSAIIIYATFLSTNFFRLCSTVENSHPPLPEEDMHVDSSASTCSLPLQASTTIKQWKFLFIYLIIVNILDKALCHDHGNSKFCSTTLTSSHVVILGPLLYFGYSWEKKHTSPSRLGKELKMKQYHSSLCWNRRRLEELFPKVANQDRETMT